MAEDVGELPECREMIADVEKCLALKDASKVPMSVRYPEQFATRGTITVSRCINTIIYFVHYQIGRNIEAYISLYLSTH